MSLASEAKYMDVGARVWVQKKHSTSFVNPISTNSAEKWTIAANPSYQIKGWLNFPPSFLMLKLKFIQIFYEYIYNKSKVLIKWQWTFNSPL